MVYSRCIAVSVFWLCTILAAAAQPRHLYLTWAGEDTARTQTIVFQTLEKATDPRVDIFLTGGQKAKSIPSKTVMLRGLSRRVHWVTLTNLKPRATYKFRAGDKRYGMSSWHTFRTLPSDATPIKIIAGGDMYRHPETVQLLDAAALQTPDVALVGGDIAYADGKLNRMQFWDDWLDNWSQHLKVDNGRLVPMILAIGNHEVDGAFGQKKTQAPFYFGFFPQGPQPYFVRKLGGEIDLIVLDSGHVTSHASQVPFLETSLKRAQARFQVALYHVPCYPTHRPYDDEYSVLGRKYWVPIFDKYGVHLALENHDHVFKRSYPLKGNKIDRRGTVYLGDGCWGRTPRSVAGRRWYHVKASPTEHVWLLENKESGLKCQAIDKHGKVFDATTIDGRSNGRNVE
jgi:Purple acid Phosphatase, N-terminal domain/Calcineurin-like phosphoesterase